MHPQVRHLLRRISRVALAPGPQRENKLDDAKRSGNFLIKHHWRGWNADRRPSVDRPSVRLSVRLRSGRRSGVIERVLNHSYGRASANS